MSVLSNPKFPTAREAYDIYRAAERAAGDAYETYWVDKFALAGIKFAKGAKPNDWALVAEHGGYILELEVMPQAFEGVKVRVYHPPAGTTLNSSFNLHHMHWTTTKVMSDSGFNKFYGRLQNKGFDQSPALRLI